jgi:hypothetical protein
VILVSVSCKIKFSRGQLHRPARLRERLNERKPNRQIVKSVGKQLPVRTSPLGHSQDSITGVPHSEESGRSHRAMRSFWV